MRLRIYLEETADGTWVGHGSGAELGCAWSASSRTDLLARAPAALRAYLEWLRRHGEPKLHIPEIIDAEVVEALSIAEPGAAAAFAWDSDPAADDDLATAMRRMHYARADILAAVYGLPPAALAWAPPGGPALQARLDELQDFYDYCFSRMGLEWMRPPSGQLGAAMAESARALHAMPYDLRGGAAWVPEPPELWTARKVLRVLLEQEYRTALAVVDTAARWRAAATSAARDTATDR